MNNTNNTNLKFISVVGLSSEANKAVNKAIIFSGEENCAEIGLVHLFLALVEKTKIGSELIERMDSSFDMLYDSFQRLAEFGEYGYLDSSNIPFSMDHFNADLMNIVTKASYTAMTSRKTITADGLISLLLEEETEELTKYFDLIGISFDYIREIQSKEFSIPEDLVDYIVDLNLELSKNNEKITNIDNYVDEIIEILSRKKKANPCLVGEAGVGKTTIIKGLAQRINFGNVPESFLNKHIVSVNGSLLTAGTRYRGDFEQRMKSIIDFANNPNIILFIDEIHAFINLNNNNDTADTAGNMIKRELADGSLRVIGATTLEEYHKYVEADKAFNRRFELVEIKEPSISKAIELIKNTISNYEKFHSVKISSEVIELTVKLSDRYIKNKMLPDKAYTILDQASAKVKLRKESVVTDTDILKVLSKITGVNVNKLGTNELKQLTTLENTLSKSIIGQEDAISVVSKAIRRAKAGVREANKPIATLLFVGPTGVGKTELCKALSNELSIGELKLIKLDMSEYSESQSISKLIGSAPGYIGYKEGGQLTEKVKHNPYSVILLDEIEKANGEVFNALLQLFDEGVMTDGEGTKIDFTNCIIIMTSNVGYSQADLSKRALGFIQQEQKVSVKEKENEAKRAIKDHFKPEFINRIDNIVVFDKLTKEYCYIITKLLLDKLKSRVLEQGIKLNFCKSLITEISNCGYSEAYGARNIKREIQDSVEDAIADAILSNELYSGCTASIKFENNKVKIIRKA